MQKIGFCDRYGLTKAVLNGTKTMTRRVEKGLENLEEGNFCYSKHNNGILLYGEKGSVIEIIKTRYKLGEVVAVAQAYNDFYNDECDPRQFPEGEGWTNKMLVKPSLMPHRIQITGIKIERLQDITDEDCLQEGIEKDYAEGYPLYWIDVPHTGISWKEYRQRVSEISRHIEGDASTYFFDNPREAFAALINRPGVGSKGLWETNPFVVVYEFKLVK
jgi:hypothetical protein